MSDKPKVPENRFDLPFDEEMERGVLGSVLINPSVFLSINAFLNAEDFFLLRHQYIWAALVRISQRGEPIERKTLRRELQDFDQFQAVGGDLYISELINSIPSAMYAEQYGMLVERDAVRRRLIQTADEIRTIAQDKQLSLEDAISTSEARLFTVSERRSQRDIVSMRDATSQYFAILENMLQRTDRGMGLPSGFRKLDALLGGLQKSDLIIFAGRPGMGKTSFMLTLALNAASRFNGRVLIFTLEMGVEQMVQRLVSMETGINMQKLRTGQFDQREQDFMIAALGRLSELSIWIDDSPALNPIQMRTRCQRLKHEYGLDLVILDYLQLMHAPGYEGNRVQEISYISRHMKELARELNVPLLSAAQLSRAVEQRSDKRPQLSDLRESGCLAGESRVWLPDERRYETMENLCGTTGFRVMSLNTETHKLEPAVVTHAFCTGTKPVYKMTTALGRSIRATGNHKFLTINGWKRLDELTESDHLALPRKLDSLAVSALPDAELASLGDSSLRPSHAVQSTTVELEALAESDVYWDRIVSIEPDGKTEVYDLTVPQHSNFTAENIIAHNSIEQDSDIVMFLYRDVVYNEATENPNQADIIVAKHRNGPTDTIPLYFDSTITRFVDGTRQNIDLSSL